MSIKWILSACVLIAPVIMAGFLFRKRIRPFAERLAAFSVLAVLVLAVTFIGKRSDILWRRIGLSGRQEVLQTAFWPEQKQAQEDFGKWQTADWSDETEKVQTFLSGRQANLKLSKEEQEAYRQVLKGEAPYPVQSPISAENVRRMDLNFDGWNDLCIQGRSLDGINVPCYCMLWNPQKQKFEYSVTLCNVEADLENQWIVSQVAGTEGESFSTYCRYDAENRLHMIRYVEENRSEDGFEQLDLTYVDDAGPYTLQAIVDEERFNLTMVEMARQALSELYQWTGEKVERACFQVSDAGGVVFSQTPEDMVHSRIFFSRYFGADTQYNLSGYDKSISSIGLTLGRKIWYSPVLWRVFPENKDAMTDEEVVRWYFERLPTSDGEKVKSMIERYEGIWTIQTKSGHWYEVFYDRELREVSDVTGPYPELPVH